MRRIAAFGVFFLVAAVVPPALAVPDTSNPTSDELQERERIRPSVEAALADLRSPAHPEEPLVVQHQRVVASLAGLGPAVVPFLAAELDLPDPLTFAPSAWALGLVSTAPSTAAIRKALEAADREGGGFGRVRKVWCVYALALAGDPSALQAAAGGNTPVDWYEFMDGMRVADVAAVLTAPESRSLLTQQIERLLSPRPPEASDDAEPGDRLVHAVRALGWVGDAESAKLLTSLLSHPDLRVAVEAVVSLGRIGNGGALDGIMKALHGGSSDVRAEAARALYLLRPSNRSKEIASRLESEEETAVRSWLYRDIAVLLDPDAALEVFRSHRARADTRDRVALAYAIGETGSRSALNLLRVLLRDASTDVALAATRSIHLIGGEGATDTLLALIDDPRPAVSQTAVEFLSADGERRAAPRIAETVVRMTSRAMTDPGMRSQVQIRAEALVHLGYVAPIDDLRRNASIQPDPADRQILESTALRLERIAALNDDVSSWTEQSRSTLPWERALAYERLAEIGGAKAVTALLQALDRADGDEEAALLAALARLNAAAAADAFERRLSDPAWDSPARQDARAAAAWGARRLGTASLAEALNRSALRREGRDFATLVYLAVLSPDRATPTIRRVLPLRLRFYDWPVGEEQSNLLEILNALEAGRTLETWDRDPSEFHRH